MVALWRPHTSFLPELSFAKKVLLALVLAEQATGITHLFFSLTLQVIEDAACRIPGLLTIVVAGTEVGGKKSMDLLILPNSAIIDP